MRKKDVVGIVTFDLIGLLPTNHIIAYITMAYRRFLRKSLMLTAKTTQSIWNILLLESQVYKKWQSSVIILEISDSNLESGRYGPKSGFSRIIWESWQPCFCLRPWNMAVNSVVAASPFGKYKYKMRKVAISSLLSSAADLPLICSCPVYQLWYCTSNT